MRYLPARSNQLVAATGLARSGTTILLNLMRSADNVAGFSEPHNCLWTHGTCPFGDGMPDAGVETMGELESVLQDTKRSADLVVVKEVYQPTPKSPVEHLPDYAVKMADRVVVILRNPVHVISSQLTALGPDFQLWYGRMLSFVSAVQAMSAERDVKIISYHDLVSRPVDTLNKAVEGLGMYEGVAVPKPFKGFGDRNGLHSEAIYDAPCRRPLNRFQCDVISRGVGDWYRKHGVPVG